jgi:glucose dehydrogenase
MKRWSLFFAMAVALGAAEITSETLRNAQQDANNWISTGRTLNGWRHSPLTQIHTSNVKRLTPQWVYQTGTLGRFEGTPLVFDNRMYITGPDNHAWALDLLTGRPIGTYYKACRRA